MANLVFVSEPTVGGTAVHVAGLARFAHEAGHEVTVACPTNGHLARWVIEAGMRHKPLELRREVSWSAFARVKELRHLIRSADLVHLHSSIAGAMGRVALATLGRRRPPSVFTPHGWSWLVGGIGSSLYQTVERNLALVSDITIAVSDWDAEEGRRVLGPGARIVTVPNGIDLDRFRGEGPVASTTCGQMVLVVGRLSRAKGQDLALRAASFLKDMDVEFRFIGAGEEESRLLQLAASLELEKVSFLGEQDPAPHYRAADILLVPSRWDACSLVLLEALACGAPVLASSGVGVAGAFRKQIHHLSTFEPASIANALRVLLTDDDERLKGVSEGTALVRSRWSDTESFQQTLKLYGNLLG